MKTTHKIITGDCRNMREVKDNSIDLIITSPPYWQLKDYGTPGELGFGHTYEEYINHLNLVWQECYRVLDGGCRLCINIGDQYARSVYYGRYKIIPIRTEIIKFCETIGFDYMGAIIWQKMATTHTSGGAVIMGSFPYPRNGIVKLDYEFILLFKKSGKSTKKIPKEIKDKSKMTKEEWNTYFSGHWNFPGCKQTKHLAMFPEELPRRLIKMFSFVGDTVLDPFLGSGTTSAAAIELDRNSVGYEINKEYIEVIGHRLEEKRKVISSTYEVDFIKQKNSKENFEQRLKKLPYIFKDPIPLNRNMDPREMTFESKIDKHSEGKLREKYYSVERVISPVHLLLKGGREIRLKGICENIETRDKAIHYLENKIKGTRIFLKFENEEEKRKFEDSNENGIGVYVHLKNRTHVNLHILKEKLVDVNTRENYRFKKQFIKIMNKNV